MVMISIKPLPGNTRMVRRMRDLAARFADFRPAFDTITATFWLQERYRFYAEGPGWKALDPKTETYKEAHGYTTKILGARTGDLEASLVGPNSGSVLGYAPWAMFVGTDVPYAHFHQYGMPHNPERPLVDVTEETARLWGRILQGWIDGVKVER